MKYIYMMLGLGFLVFMFTFGIDRELARKDYVRLLGNNDYEQKIEGCLYRCNCRYYTELLWTK